jgi:hypothetical protein
MKLFLNLNNMEKSNIHLKFESRIISIQSYLDWLCSNLHLGEQNISDKLVSQT